MINIVTYWIDLFVNKILQVQRYRDDNLPEDGTIYYAVNDDDTYVQAVEGDQQYQFVNQEQMETENQEWETGNQNEEEQPEQVKFTLCMFITVVIL